MWNLFYDIYDILMLCSSLRIFETKYSNIIAKENILFSFCMLNLSYVKRDIGDTLDKLVMLS